LTVKPSAQPRSSTPSPSASCVVVHALSALPPVSSVAVIGLNSPLPPPLKVERDLRYHGTCADYGRQRLQRRLLGRRRVEQAQAREKHDERTERQLEATLIAAHNQEHRQRLCGERQRLGVGADGVVLGEAVEPRRGVR